jgi:tetratricopeptide (TPR) repeat protein
MKSEGMVSMSPSSVEGDSPCQPYTLDSNFSWSFTKSVYAVVSDEASQTSNQTRGTSTEPMHQEQGGPGLPDGVEETGLYHLPPAGDGAFDWNVVDVIGSPGLTKLIGALTIEQCDDIPLLDLTADDCGGAETSRYDLLDLCYNFSAFSTERTTRPYEITRVWPRASLQYELYPFPQSRIPILTTTGNGTSASSCSPRWTESECEAKLRTLKRMKVSEIPQLVDSMWNIAISFYDVACYDLAETWFRHIITAKQLIPYFRHHETLKACLYVVESMALAGRYVQGRVLHEDLHREIQRTVGPSHELALASKALLASFLRRFGNDAGEESVRRELLQGCLNALGTRHIGTITALADLGSCLQQHKLYCESDQLLGTAIQFQLEAAWGSERRNFHERGACLAIIHLVRTLNLKRRYNETETLLKNAAERFKDLIQGGCRVAHHYHYVLARTWRLQGRPYDAEAKLRSLLKDYGKSMTPNRKIDTLRELSEVMIDTGRQGEATEWLQKVFFVYVETFGLAHYPTMASCKTAGFCWAEQRRYHDALLLFQQTIEGLVAGTFPEIEIREGYVREVEGWIAEVQEMCAADSMDGTSTESEDASTETSDTAWSGDGGDRSNITESS